MRRPLLQPLVALALAALFVAPVAAAEPGGAGTETLKGTLDALYVETFEEAHPHERYELRTAHGQVPLEFGDGGPDGLEGAQVEVTGTRKGKTLHVASSRPGRDLKVLHKATEQELGALLTTDGDGGTTTADGGVHDRGGRHQEHRRDPHQLQGQHVAAVHEEHGPDRDDRQRDERQEVRRGGGEGPLDPQRDGLRLVHDRLDVHLLRTGATGRRWAATRPPPPASTSRRSRTSCTSSRTTDSCGWAGVAYVNGTKSMLNGNYSVQVTTHELGHNWGLGHANALYCTSGSTRVAIAATSACESKAYQDPYSTMGNNALRHNHGSQLGELGLLSASQKVTGRPRQHLHDRARTSAAAGQARPRAPRRRHVHRPRLPAPRTAASTRSRPARRRSPA